MKFTSTFKALPFLCAAFIGTPTDASAQSPIPNITGYVRADGKPLSGVQVSDGKEIVTTDRNGHYELVSDKTGGTVFITTPSGYVAESSDNFQPGFWNSLECPVDIPETSDFNLTAQSQDRFAIIFTTDTHLTNDTTKDDLMTYERLVMPRIRQLAKDYGKDRPVYSFNLGDLSHEIYWYELGMPLDRVVDYVVRTGYPTLMYSISGNHDNDGAVTGHDTDHRAAWLYRQTLGPAQYAINIGNTHWIMLDNIIYKNIEGKGKKAKGIRGDRSYDVGFTQQQLDWLAKDLSSVNDSMKVFICCHAPLLYPKNESGLLLTDHSQMDVLDKMLSRFKHVTIFSGHAHRNLYRTHKQYPRFCQYVLGATSGSMWNTSKHYQTIGEDGSAAGVWAANFTDGADPDIKYHTYIPGDPMFRAYDLNEVGRYYRNNPDVQHQLKLYPGRVDYSNPEFTNMIMVNFWCERDGLSLEITENGKPLATKKEITLEDPLYNISYYVPLAKKNGIYHKSHDNIRNHHMYMAKASDATTPVKVTVKDNAGHVMYQETIIRPKVFDKNAK